jgi:hypothetical protein
MIIVVILIVVSKHANRDSAKSTHVPDLTREGNGENAKPTLARSGT